MSTLLKPRKVYFVGFDRLIKRPFDCFNSFFETFDMPYRMPEFTSDMQRRICEYQKSLDISVENSINTRSSMPSHLKRQKIQKLKINTLMTSRYAQKVNELLVNLHSRGSSFNGRLRRERHVGFDTHFGEKVACILQ